MASYFSAEEIADLHRHRQEIHQRFRALQEPFMTYNFTNVGAREHAQHGFCRRLHTLAQSIDHVFEMLPPEREDIPELQEVTAATIAIQAFTMNAFGCLENLAWIWVLEKNVKGKSGLELKPKDIGLGKPYVQQSFSTSFRAFLESRKEWLGHLINFRDSLAHRIPLYIPPYVIPEDKFDEYKKLEGEALGERGRADPKEYRRLREEQRKLCRFQPWMTHSIYDKAPLVVFHSQLVNDYVTIDEYGWRMLEELD